MIHANFSYRVVVMEPPSLACLLTNFSDKLQYDSADRDDEVFSDRTAFKMNFVVYSWSVNSVVLSCFWLMMPI